jgi:hypothetical protein
MKRWILCLLAGVMAIALCTHEAEAARRYRYRGNFEGKKTEAPAAAPTKAPKPPVGPIRVAAPQPTPPTTIVAPQSNPPKPLPNYHTQGQALGKPETVVETPQPTLPPDFVPPTPVESTTPAAIGKDAPIVQPPIPKGYPEVRPKTPTGASAVGADSGTTPVAKTDTKGPAPKLVTPLRR